MVALSVPCPTVPEIDGADLLLEEALGAGTYGAVFKAKWKSKESKDLIVAAKKVFVLEQEAAILSQCRHKNIIQFYGTSNIRHCYWIITEFASKGSLADYLLDPGNPDLDFENICEWAVDIAQGMHYLHNEAVVPIVHRDLKSKNVVISSTNICKLCDFGACKAISDTSTSMSHAGTAAWMSPEMINGKATSFSTDVWSYGVVLWELVTRQVPFRDLTFFQVCMLVTDGTRLILPTTCPPLLVQMVHDCWILDPKKRPSSTKVLERVRLLSCNKSISEDMKKFLSSKSRWIKEIELHRDRLKKREQHLMGREAALLKEQKHRPYCLDRSLAPTDVNDWDELFVVQWLYSIDLGVTKVELDKLATLVHDHHINGQRLLMISEGDMKHMGIASLGLTKKLMQIVQMEKQNNTKQIEFPPLGYSPDMHRSVSVPDQYLVEQVIQTTLLLGYIYYEDNDTGILWWKVFLDSFQNDQVAGLIKEVKFLFPRVDDQEPMKTRGFGQLPMACEHYLNVQLKQLSIDCIVYFTDAVIKPRNAKISRQITHPSPSVITRRVHLTVRKDNKRHRNVSSVTPPRPQLLGDWCSPLSSGSPIIPSPTTPIPPNKCTSAFSTAASVLYRKCSVPTPSPQPISNGHVIRAQSDQPANQPVHFSLNADNENNADNEAKRPRSMSASSPPCNDVPTRAKHSTPHKHSTLLTPLRLTPVRSESDSVLSTRFSGLSLERKESVPSTPPPLPQPFTPQPLSIVRESKKERLYEMKQKKKRKKKESLSETSDGSSKFSRSVHGGYQKLMWNH